MQEIMVVDGKRQVPKSVTIRKGAWYPTVHGYGVQVMGIRTNGEMARVYYRKIYKRHWYGNEYTLDNLAIEDFKKLLMDLGSIEAVFVSPLKKDESF